MGAGDSKQPQLLNTVPSVPVSTAVGASDAKLPSEVTTHDAPSILLAPLPKDQEAKSNKETLSVNGVVNNASSSLSNNANSKMSLTVGHIVSPSSLSARLDTTGEDKNVSQSLRKASGENEVPKSLESTASNLDGVREQICLSNISNSISVTEVAHNDKIGNSNLLKARKDNTSAINKRTSLNFETNDSLKANSKKDLNPEEIDFSTTHNDIASDLRYGIGASGTQIGKNESQSGTPNKLLGNEEILRNSGPRQIPQSHLRQNSVDTFLASRQAHSVRSSEKRNSLLDLSSNPSNHEMSRLFDQNAVISKAISNISSNSDVRTLIHRGSIGTLNNSGSLGSLSDANGVNVGNSVIGNGIRPLHSLNNAGSDAPLSAGENIILNTDPPSSMAIHSLTEHNLGGQLDSRESLGGHRKFDLEDAIRRQNRPGRKFGAKKKLWVWSWFVQDPTDPNVAVCDYCGKVVKRRSSDKGSPKKLSEHLRTHKLTKSLANNTRAMLIDGGGMNYNGGQILLPFGENGLNRRKSSLSLLGLQPQQLHQLPLLTLHQLHSVNYANGPSSQNYQQHGQDPDRSNNEQINQNVQIYSSISPPSHQNNQNYTGPMPQSSAQHRQNHQNHQNHRNHQDFQNHQNIQNNMGPQNHSLHNHQSQSGNHIHPRLSVFNGPPNQGNQGNTNSHLSQNLPNQYGPQQQAQLSPLSRNQQSYPQQKFANQLQNAQSHRGPSSQRVKQNSHHHNHDMTHQDIRDENDNISPEIRLQSQKLHRPTQYDNGRIHNSSIERQLAGRTIGVEDRYEDGFAHESFDETPYSETKLLRHLLAFLHENKLSIDVIKLPSFRQLVYDLRPDSIKDLLVLDTVYSSCVEVARTSSNSQLSQDSVFSMNGAINKVDPEILRK